MRSVTFSRYMKMVRKFLLPIIDLHTEQILPFKYKALNKKLSHFAELRLKHAVLGR